MNEIVLAPATRQLETRARRQDLCGRTGRGAHPADRAAESATECICGLRCGTRARAGARAGCRCRKPRGPLHGLPVTIKSSIATAGYRCEIGSLLHKGEIPHEDAVVVGRLRAAGALILGTTNCPEFLMAYETANLLHGRDAQSMGPGSFAGRIERRRIGSHCGWPVGGWAGQRQRRIGARAGALHGNLLAEADAGPGSGARPSAAVRRPVLDSRRDWANGAHDGGR